MAQYFTRLRLATLESILDLRTPAPYIGTHAMAIVFGVAFARIIGIFILFTDSFQEASAAVSDIIIVVLLFHFPEMRRANALATIVFIVIIIAIVVLIVSMDDTNSNR
jgi:hypothetical protein